MEKLKSEIARMIEQVEKQRIEIAGLDSLSDSYKINLETSCTCQLSQLVKALDLLDAQTYQQREKLL